MRGQIALEQRRGSDAGRLLVSAAKRLEPLDANLARETHLEALGAALAADLDIPGGLLEAAEAARAAPPGPDPPRAVDVLLDAFALRVTDGYAAAAPKLTRALELLLALEVTDDEARRSLWLAGAEPAPSSPSSSGMPSPSTCWPLGRRSSPARRARSCTCSSRSAFLPEAISSQAS